MKARDNRKVFLMALMLLIFMLYAWFLNSFGTSAGLMIGYFGITTAQQGFILTAMSISGVAVSILLGLFGEYFNKLYLLLIGFAVFAAASLLMGLLPLTVGVSYGLFLVFAVAAGFGYTTVDTMVNGIIPEVYGEKSQTLLPAAHTFFSVTAMLAPVIMTAVTNPQVFNSFGLVYAAIGGVSVALSVVYALSAKGLTKATPYAGARTGRKRPQSPIEIYKIPKTWLYFAVALFYFTFQSGVTAWLPSYLQSEGLDYVNAGIIMTMFYAGALAMRVFLPLILKKLSLNLYYVICAGLSFGCFALCFLTGVTGWEAAALVAAGGFFQGGLAPAMVMICCNAFPTRTASASAITCVAVNVGFMLSPYIMGVIAQTSFRWAMLFATGSLALAALIILVVLRLEKRETAKSEQS